MPIIPIIWFSLLVIWFYRKEERIGIATTLTLFYLVSAVCGFFIDKYDLYGMFGVADKVVSIPGTILYCLGLTVLLFPFQYLHLSPGSKLQIDKPVLFKVIGYFMILCFIIFLIKHGSDIREASTKDFSEVKAEHYDDLGFAQDGGSQSFIFTIAGIVSSAWSLCMLMWFISISFMRNSLFLNIGLLICSLQHVLQGILIAGRAAILYWAVCFACCIVIFYPLMEDTLKRRIRIGTIVLGTCFVLFFMAITASRFEDSADNGIAHSLIAYAGQPYNNFCAVYENAENLPFATDRIFPLFNKYILGHGQFHLKVYYDQISSIIGIPVNCFYTFMGGLLLNVGFFGIIIALIVYYICSYKTIMAIHNDFTAYNMILMSLLVLVPIQGMFDLPFPYVSDSLVIFYTIGIYIIFKYTIKKS